MSDRELLEKAAKAAGYWNFEFDCYKGPISWDPIEKDEDALRLAVQLRLGLVHGWESFEENPLATVWISHDGQCLAEEIKGDDPYAATRRAIVRAAAEIGKGMK